MLEVLYICCHSGMGLDHMEAALMPQCANATKYVKGKKEINMQQSPSTSETVESKTGYPSIPALPENKSCQLGIIYLQGTESFSCPIHAC